MALADGIVYLEEFKTFGTRKRATIHKIDAVTGQEVAGYPVDLEPELQQKAAEIYTEIDNPADVTASIFNVVFSTGGREIIADWRVSDAALSGTQYGIIHYDLENREFIGALGFSKNPATDTNTRYLPKLPDGDSFDSPIIIAAYNSSLGLFEVIGLDRGFGSVLWQKTPTSPNPTETGGVYPVSINRSTGVVSGFSRANIGASEDTVLYYFNGSDGSGYNSQYKDPPPGGYSYVLTAGTGASFEVITIPRGATSINGPISGGELVNVLDSQFSFIESHPILNYVSDQIDGKIYIASLRPGTGDIFIGFSPGSEVPDNALLKVADLSDQIAIPNFSVTEPQLSDDGTVMMGYSSGIASFTIIEVASGTVSSQPAVIEEVDSGWAFSGYVLPPAAPTAFWTAFNGTYEQVITSGT